MVEGIKYYENRSGHKIEIMYSSNATGVPSFLCWNHTTDELDVYYATELKPYQEVSNAG